MGLKADVIDSQHLAATQVPEGFGQVFYLNHRIGDGAREIAIRSPPWRTVKWLKCNDLTGPVCHFAAVGATENRVNRTYVFIEHISQPRPISAARWSPKRLRRVVSFGPVEVAPQEAPKVQSHCGPLFSKYYAG